MIGSPERGSTPPSGSRSLAPGDFSFHGFGELRLEELRKISKLGIRSDTPTASVVDDAIFVPTKGDATSDQSKVIGGIVRSDGQPVEGAQLHRRGGKHFGGLAETVAVTAEHQLDEEVVYLGPLFNHYGRCLLESLARVWYLSAVDPSVKVSFSHTTSAKGSLFVEEAYRPWVFKLLSLFGIPSQRILALKEPTRLRRAIVPEPLFEQHYSAHVDMVCPFREVAARVAAGVTPSRQPLYLSRRRLTSSERPVIGESELEDLLRAQGFAVAYPETMPLDDQIRLINSHADIFSSIGSAAHSILFALGKPRLHLLAHRESIPANFFLCSAIAEAPTTFVNCLGSGDRKRLRAERSRHGADRVDIDERDSPGDLEIGPQSMPQLIEMDRVIQYLDETRFLKNNAQVALPDSAAASLRRRYDEAWLAVHIRKTTRWRGSLPADLEREALDLAERSWPLSFMLALYYARNGDRAGTEALAKQFMTLIAEESDPERLAYHNGDIVGKVKQVQSKCEPETAERLATVIATRFPMERRGRDDLPSRSSKNGGKQSLRRRV